MNLLAFQEYQVYQVPHFDQGAQVFQVLQDFLVPQAFQWHLQVLYHQLHLFLQEGLRLKRVNYWGSEITLTLFIYLLLPLVQKHQEVQACFHLPLQVEQQQLFLQVDQVNL